jgi:hypothetical protein
MVTLLKENRVKDDVSALGAQQVNDDDSALGKQCERLLWEKNK